jgi:uncharacterized membrane protein
VACSWQVDVLVLELVVVVLLVGVLLVDVLVLVLVLVLVVVKVVSGQTSLKSEQHVPTEKPSNAITSTLHARSSQ